MQIPGNLGLFGWPGSFGAGAPTRISGGFGAPPVAETGATEVPFAAEAPQGDAQRVAEEKAYANLMNDRFQKECQTCKNRTYQDGSNDPGVSFKSPQHIDPSVAASVVMGHEQEHVSHERARASQEGGEVVNQSVRLHGAFCPECGRYYIAGGVTETTVRHGGENKDPQQEQAHGHGGEMNVTA